MSQVEKEPQTLEEKHGEDKAKLPAAPKSKAKATPKQKADTKAKATPAGMSASKKAAATKAKAKAKAKSKVVVKKPNDKMTRRKMLLHPKPNLRQREK